MAKLRYEKLSKQVAERIASDRLSGTVPQFGFNEELVIRRNPDIDKANVLRTAFIRDIDKIMHCPYYNRYTDKT